MSATPVLPLALLQFNATVGDVDGNADRIIALARQAHADGARLVLTPELALTGYPPEDLLLRPAFMQACEAATDRVAAALADLDDLFLVLGHPQSLHEDVRTRSMAVQHRVNAATVLHRGARLGSYAKRELPNYQVFDERRYFVSGRDAGLAPLVVEVAGVRIGVLICEDAWFDEPGAAAKAAGAQALVVLNASPFHLGKAQEREARMAERARALSLPVAYAHLVGGQDEIVFDGASFVVDAQGAVQARAASFDEAVLHARVSADGRVAGTVAPLPGEEAQAWGALVTGVRDYLGKNGFPGAILGLSGGIDSALVLAVAVDALGADRVRTVMMPSRYTADISWIDAREMARRLGVRYDEIPIGPMFDAFRQSLAAEFAGLPEDATEENIQARVRGTLLMALSNKSGRIVLTTGNKSEMAIGYCTLYGDMAGGFAVIKDVAKTLVYRLARLAQRARRRPPASSRRSPSASSPGRRRPSCGPTRPTRTACRPTRCSTRSSRSTWRRTSRSSRSSPPAMSAPRWSAWRG